MRKVSVFVIAIFLACPTFGANESREQKRLAACGQVFKEILDIPDGIPKDLLNKAECVIVIPSVLKFAGALPHCSRSKVQTSVCSWAVRPRTSSSWS